MLLRTCTPKTDLLCAQEHSSDANERKPNITSVFHTLQVWSPASRTQLGMPCRLLLTVDILPVHASGLGSWLDVFT